MAWDYAYSQDIWPAIISAALTIVLGLYSWHRRNVPGAKAFAIGCLFAMLWAIGASLEISAVDFLTKVFWIKFQSVWQPFTVTVLSCFYLEFAGLGRFLTARKLLLLFVPAFLTAGLMLTNNYHQLIWTSFSLDALNDHVVVEYGIGTWISLLYVILLGLVILFALLQFAVKSPQSRWPVALISFGLISGRIMYLLNSIFTDLFSPGESVFFVIGISCSFYAYVLFHYHVLNPIPLARSLVIEQMSDGMLVLDLQGRIIDINHAAELIFDKPTADLCGRSVIDIMPSGFAAQVGPTTIEFAVSELSLSVGDAGRDFSLALTRLLDAHENALGYLLLLHDITGQRRSQELLLETQRVYATLQERERLARELHDSIGQVLGYVSMQAQAASKWVLTGNTEKTLPILNQLTAVAQEAHADVRESILNLKTEMFPEWTFPQALRKCLTHYQTSYGINVELLLPETPDTVDLNPEVGVHVIRVIQEAMTNADLLPKKYTSWHVSQPEIFSICSSSICL